MIALGVDGGNTKTVAVAASADGARWGAGWAGRADIHNAVTPAHAIDEVVRASRDALDAAGATTADVEAAYFGLAGADWPEDFALLERELARELGLHCPARVINDAIAPIRAGTPDGVGVAVVVGTYGISGGRNAAGDVYHVGFWPDSTGAHPLAREGLDAVERAWLGLGPETSMTAPVVEHFGARDPWDMLHRVTRRENPMTDLVDDVAGIVLGAADAGDEVALALVDRHCRILAGQARACARGVGLSERGFPLVITGGLLRNPSTRVSETIVSYLDEPAVSQGAHHPALGSLLFAFDELGADPSSDLLLEAGATIDGDYNQKARVRT